MSKRRPREDQAALEPPVVVPQADGLIFQYAQGEAHNELLKLTSQVHQLYALNHRFEFQSYPVEIPVDARFGWYRFEQILKAFAAGYAFVAYLETDTLIVNPAVDLRSALGDEPLGMAWGAVPGGEPQHWNCGTIYARNDPRVITFLEAMMAAQPDADVPEEMGGWWTRPHCVQTIMNNLLLQPEWAGLCARLDSRWNCVAGLMDVSNTVVMAWHGLQTVEQKLAAMRLAVGQA